MDRHARHVVWADAYRGGQSTLQIAREYDVRKSSVRQALKKLGVQMRRGGRVKIIVPGKEAEHARNYHLWHAYGATPEWYKEQLARQGGHCAVCPATRGSPHRAALYVDHKHVDGYADLPSEEKQKYNRGLLCSLHTSCWVRLATASKLLRR